jgi:hypothetical protein
MLIAVQRSHPTDESHGWYSGPPRDAAELESARRLHTRRYAQRGVIPQQRGRLFDDGWMDRRDWVVVVHHGSVVGAASLVSPTHTLPTLAGFGIDPSADPRLRGSWRNGRIREVSTLCRDEADGAAALPRGELYRALWLAREREDDHDLWLMSMAPRGLDHLSRLFPVPFEVIGTAAQYYGEPAVACMLDLRLVRPALSARAPQLLTWLDGEEDADSRLTA